MNGYLKKKCTYAKIGPKIPQNDPHKEKAWCKTFSEGINHPGYTMNTCTKFHEKILNSHEILDKPCPKWAQKCPPNAPQQGQDMEKNSTVTLKRNIKDVCAKFHGT